MKAGSFDFSRVIAEKIRQVRRTKDYSQQFMADRLGISQNAYSKLESGKTPIHLDRLCEVSVLLDISAFELFEELFELLGQQKAVGLR